jgi:hypothetical protein
MSEYRVVSNGVQFKVQKKNKFLFWTFWTDMGTRIFMGTGFHTSVEYFNTIENAEVYKQSIIEQDKKWNSDWREVK